MANVNPGNRPLSPHLQVYRLPLNAYMSIVAQRVAGVAMAGSMVLIAWYFLALAAGPDYFAVAEKVLTSWYGSIALILSAIGLWFHLVNGVRHLIWDTGSHFGQKSVNRSAYMGIVAAVVLVIITLIVAWT